MSKPVATAAGALVSAVVFLFDLFLAGFIVFFVMVAIGAILQSRP